MVVAFISLLPVALGLFLLAFGVPDRPLLSPTPTNVGAVLAAAVIVGPIAQIALGFAGWLALVALLVAVTLVVAGLGTPRRRTAQD